MDGNIKTNTSFGLFNFSCYIFYIWNKEVIFALN